MKRKSKKKTGGENATGNVSISSSTSTTTSFIGEEQEEQQLVPPATQVNQSLENNTSISICESVELEKMSPVAASGEGISLDQTLSSSHYSPSSSSSSSSSSGEGGQMGFSSAVLIGMSDVIKIEEKDEKGEEKEEEKENENNVSAPLPPPPPPATTKTEGKSQRQTRRKQQQQQQEEENEIEPCPEYTSIASLQNPSPPSKSSSSSSSSPSSSSTGGGVAGGLPSVANSLMRDVMKSQREDDDDDFLAKFDAAIGRIGEGGGWRRRMENDAKRGRGKDRLNRLAKDFEGEEENEEGENKRVTNEQEEVGEGFGSSDEGYSPQESENEEEEEEKEEEREGDVSRNSLSKRSSNNNNSSISSKSSRTVIPARKPKESKWLVLFRWGLLLFILYRIGRSFYKNWKQSKQLSLLQRELRNVRNEASLLRDRLLSAQSQLRNFLSSPSPTLPSPSPPLPLPPSSSSSSSSSSSLHSPPLFSSILASFFASLPSASNNSSIHPIRASANQREATIMGKDGTVLVFKIPPLFRF